MASRRSDPTIHRRRLRSELRKAREAAGFTQRDVAAAMDWSLSKLLRIETGAVSVSTTDLRALLGHYGVVDPARVNALVDIARVARERSWWRGYSELASQEFLTFLGYESSAAVIRNFEPLLVPGLLQTEEYAREVINVIVNPDRRRLEALVELRIERQQILDVEDPPAVHCILDEAVVRRMVGGRDVMRRQLRHLHELARRPGITLRIIPFHRGMYPRLRVPYVLFEFPHPEDEDALFVENSQGDFFVENPQGDLLVRENQPEDRSITPVSYLETFFQLEQLAPRDETPALLDDAIANLSGGEHAPGPEAVERQPVGDGPWGGDPDGGPPPGPAVIDG